MSLITTYGPDFLVNLAASLAYDLLQRGGSYLRTLALGAPEQQALEAAWQVAFAHMLREIATESADEPGVPDQLLTEHIGSLFQEFINTDNVAIILLDVALAGKTPPLGELAERFDELDYDRETLPVNFKQAIRALTDGLTEALLEAATSADSPLHNWVNIVRLVAIQQMLAQQQETVEKMATQLAQLDGSLQQAASGNPNLNYFDPATGYSLGDGAFTDILMIALQSYLNELYEEVGWLHVIGRRSGQSIDEIYIDVFLLDEVREDRWLVPATLKSDFRQQIRPSEGRRGDGMDIVDRHKRVFILGSPGMGKTTFLKQIVRREISQEKSVLPIFVGLREFAYEIERNSDLTCLDYIVQKFREYNIPNAEVYLTKQLKTGNGLVLFDGLDEVKEEGNLRSILMQRLNSFIKVYGGRTEEGNRIIITCREAAQTQDFFGFKYFQMAEFDEIQQRAFVGKWFKNMDTVSSFWQALHQDRLHGLQELAEVPLLMTLLCIAFQYGGESFRGNTRFELYEDATRVLLETWDNKRGVQRDWLRLSTEEKEALLAYIAAESFDEGKYLIEENLLVDLIEKHLTQEYKMQKPDGRKILLAIEMQHGILIKQGRRIHSFSHPTLQEYYTARYIVDNKEKSTLAWLMKHIGQDRWREVFLLTAGIWGDSTTFFRTYLEELVRMIEGETEIVWLLTWAALKAEEAGGDHPAVAIRAAYLNIFSLALDLDLNPVRARAVALDLHDAYVLGLAHPRNNVTGLDLFLSQARDLATALNLDLHRAHPLAKALELDLYLADSLALHRAIDRIFGRGAINGYASFLVSFLGRAIDLARQSSKSLDLDLLEEVLATLELPTKKSNRKEIVAFKQALQEVAFRHRDLGHEWMLDDERTELLNRYLAGMLVLVECLEMSDVEDRKEILEQLLLPPAVSIN